jgi:hypothetical protein
MGNQEGLPSARSAAARRAADRDQRNPRMALGLIGLSSVSGTIQVVFPRAPGMALPAPTQGRIRYPPAVRPSILKLGSGLRAWQALRRMMRISSLISCSSVFAEHGGAVRISIFSCLIWAFARPLLYGSAAAVLSASISHNSTRAKHRGRRYGIVMRRWPTDPAFQYCRGWMPPGCRPFRKCVADAAGRARRCRKYRPHSMLPTH